MRVPVIVSSSLAVTLWSLSQSISDGLLGALVPSGLLVCFVATGVCFVAAVACVFVAAVATFGVEE